MKKMICLILVVLPWIPVWSKAQSSFFSPFYFGGGLGVSDFSTKLNYQMTPINTPPVGGTSFDQSLMIQRTWSQYFAAGGFFLGAQFFQKHSFYFGGEIGVSAGNHNVSSQFSSIEAIGAGSQQEQIVANNTTGIWNWIPYTDFLVGFLITPHSLLFARVGAAYTVATTQGLVTAANNNSNPLLTFTYNVPKNTEGLRVGLGLTETVYRHFQIRTDFLMTYYNVSPQIRTARALNVNTGTQENLLIDVQAKNFWIASALMNFIYNF